MIVELSELSVVLLPDSLALKSNNECINSLIDLLALFFSVFILATNELRNKIILL